MLRTGYNWVINGYKRKNPLVTHIPLKRVMQSTLMFMIMNLKFINFREVSKYLAPILAMFFGLSFVFLISNFIFWMV